MSGLGSLQLRVARFDGVGLRFLKVQELWARKP